MRGRLLPLLFAVVLCAPSVRAQVTVRLVVEGAEQSGWQPMSGWSADSLAAVAHGAAHWLARQGYPLATVDSIAVADSLVLVFASRGPQVGVAEIRVVGAERFTEAHLLGLADTRPGRTFDPDVLRSDVDRMLGAYESAGFGLAQVEVTRFDLVATEDGAVPGISIELRVDEGTSIALREVALAAGTRTRPAYAARLLGLTAGEPLPFFDPAEAQRRLEASGLFTRVDTPELLVHPDGTATLRIEAAEAPPGAFDLVVGLLPPDGARRQASLVGSGHLLLSNLFGLGHRYELRLNRLPGQVSSVNAQAAVPYVLGLPLRVEAGFDGAQQDSTFGQQRYRGGLAYGDGGREVLATVSREAIKPGVAGAQVTGGQQRVARSSATFVGIGFRLYEVDAPLNPRRGYAFETLLERGRRERARTVVLDGVAERERTAFRQERLTLAARLYRPLGSSLVAALGVDGYALRSDAYEEAELFRIGGATTLRGYDEERFRARYAARALAELRVPLDRLSYAFVFADAAYLDQPDAPGVSSLRGFYPGYGLGVQVSTGVGLIVATYAAAPEAGLTSGRVHLGLSFGL